MPEKDTITTVNDAIKPKNVAITPKTNTIMARIMKYKTQTNA